ncbi:hypothetical protein SOASR030_11520 [Leminorella grimontii]|uniref:Uncharacterized protein n=1 Tax=Leminorella grimontii TaxID=82981 RepID=A0AAV5N0K7_9GAMM|nr:hypothetical protein SOASR030_11520 [Leminorella grimontii]GKX58463.1 hypothetical protein SOASR031_07780 [Leminorella grimontii]
MTPVSQALTQAWQRVQPSTNREFSTDQGGLIAVELLRHWPRSRFRLDNVDMLTSNHQEKFLIFY